MKVPAPYPPDAHILRDLQITYSRAGTVSSAEMPIFPEICDARSAVRAGIVATFVDAYAGGAALRAVHPDWIATGDLSLQTLHPLTHSKLRASARVLRAGRRTVVLEVELRDAAERLEPSALATMTFSRLPRRDVQKFDPGDDDGSEPSSIPLLGEGLRIPVLDRIGIEVIDAAAGIVEVPKASYIANSLQSIQGGVMALIVDAACELAAGSAVGAPVATEDLAIHYLELSRVGPVHSRVRILRRSNRVTLLRVELHDAGDNDRLLSVATASAVAI